MTKWQNAYRNGLLHELVVMRLEVLHEEACGDGLGHVGSDVDEPAGNRIDYHDQEGHVPKGDISQSDICEYETKKAGESHHEN